MAFTYFYNRLFSQELKLTKMNSAYYCDYVRCWNKDYCQIFTVFRKITSCFNRKDHQHIVLLHCRGPAHPCAGVYWTKKLVFSSLDLNPVDYSVWRVLQQMIFTRYWNWPAETHFNQLLVSTKPEHFKPSDHLATKKTDDAYKGKGCSCWILSGQILCADDCCCYFYCKFELLKIG